MESSEELVAVPVIEKKEKSPRGGRKRASSPEPQSANGDQTNDFLAAAEGPVQPNVEVTLKTLLEAGVHFGHQTSRWHPAMAPYIYTVRNGVHIINLPKTVQAWSVAREKIVSVISRGGSILFVGTKKQAQEAMTGEAKRCGAYYVSQRWLGGMLTNFQTIRRSIDRLKTIEQTLVDEEQRLAQQLAQQQAAQLAAAAEEARDSKHSPEPLLLQKIGPKFTKKERLMMDRERIKLLFSLEGIREMFSAPDLLFVVDIKREEIAIREAQRLDIPVIALIDTNCNPQGVDFPIPSNDDATRAIRLFATAVADAVLEGKRMFAERKIRIEDKEGEGEKPSRKRAFRGAQQPTAEQPAVELPPTAPATSEVENT